MDTAQPVNVHFPKGGLDLSKGTSRQPWRQGPQLTDGTPTRIYTAAEAINVRSYEPLTSRTRGGSRVGLKRYLSAAIIPDWIIQHLNVVVGVDKGAAVQGSVSGRLVMVVPVSQGRVFWFQPGQTTPATEATNTSGSTPPLNFSGAIFSSPDNQKLYFVDGVHYRKFTPKTTTVSDWVASVGTLPADSGNKARLIETWRGRIILSGILTDPANWFMSAVTDPENWNYFTSAQTPTQAVAGNNSRLGFIGDVITSLAAYNDDLLFFGGNSSVWMMRGDPMTGGEIDLISNSIGTAWGRPFCQDPKGTLYFMSNTGAIYQMQPGGKPERLSHPIDKLLQDIDTGNNAITLAWNERYKGFHIFVTPLAGASDNSQAFFWEYPRENGTGNSWFKDRFKNKKHYPICACTLDGNTANDRVVLIGSWDGFIRAFDPDQTTDDGVVIESEVWLGPFVTKDFDEVTLKGMQAILATASGRVNYSVFVGRTPEAALASAPLLRGSGTWTFSRNLSSLGGKIAGHAIFIRLTSTDRWAMEGIRAMFSPNLSKIRRRGA
jgi:hypothetical protein